MPSGHYKALRAWRPHRPILWPVKVVPQPQSWPRAFTYHATYNGDVVDLASLERLPFLRRCDREGRLDCRIILAHTDGHSALSDANSQQVHRVLCRDRIGTR